MRREDMKWKPEISDEVIALTKAITDKFPHAKCYVCPDLNAEDLICSYDVTGITYDALRSVGLEPFEHLYIDEDHIWGPGIYVDCWSNCSIEELYVAYEEVEI